MNLKQEIEEIKKTEGYDLLNLQSDFAISIEDLIEDRQIKKKAFAEAIGTKASYVSRVLRGESNLSMKTMVKMARALDCKISITLEEKAEDNFSVYFCGDNVLDIDDTVSIWSSSGNKEASAA